MAILVDDAIWPWRGLRWAHLVSDTDYDELHDFAHRLGMPYMAFQGDHYDIHSGLRQVALAAGAKSVPGRDLVVALRQAGLRRRGGIEPWRWQHRTELDRSRARDALGDTADLVPELDAALEQVGEGTASVELGRASRPGESLIMVAISEVLDIDVGFDRLDDATTVHRSSGERGTFLELVTRDRAWG